MTHTDICNTALSYIGQGMITTLDANNESARQCRLHYDNTRKLLLRQYEWSFARRHEKLTLLNANVNGYKYIYLYPEKCLKMLAILDHQNGFDAFRQKEFEVFNIDNHTKVIASNVMLAYIDYIYDVTDCNIFDSLFLEAFTRKLASNLAVPLLGNEGVADRNYKMYQAALEEAKSLTAKERRSHITYPSLYAQVRGGE